MKTCPICHARAFDDAEVCYGCLHRFADDRSAPTASKKEDSIEDGLAKVRSVLAESRASRASQSTPCPFSGGGSVPLVARAVPAVGEGAGGAACSLDPPPSDAGWIVRFEFPGFAPVEGQAGASAQTARVQGAAGEGFVVSLRPGAAPAVARGVHARPLIEAAAPEGS